MSPRSSRRNNSPFRRNHFRLYTTKSRNRERLLRSPTRCQQGVRLQNRDTAMINLKSLVGRSQSAAAAFGALSLAVTLGAAPAHSAPLYPYGYQAPQVQQAPQIDED